MPEPVNVLSKHFRQPDPPPDYGRLAYEAYISHPPVYWPPWDELTPPRQRQWQRVGEAVREAVLREVFP